jgi:subtilisin family serine protease
MKKNIFSILFLALIFNTQSSLALSEFIDGEVIVKLKSEATEIYGLDSSDRQQAQNFAYKAHSLLMNLSSKVDATLSIVSSNNQVIKLQAQNAVDINELLETVAKNPLVEYVEPNYVYRIVGDITETPQSELDALKNNNVVSFEDSVVPNDPKFDLTWAMLNLGQSDPKGQPGKKGADIGATKAWKLTTGSDEVKVAVIDTGVDYLHEDLKNNILVNTKEIPNNGIDDDGNGYIDDVYGYNFAEDKPNAMDDNRHGTHCAGTIGAEGNNNLGVAGVNWKVKILPVKFLTAKGSGSLEGAIKAIEYATKMGVQVMSNSWGGGNYSKALEEAIVKAKNKGILFVAAAGNESNNNDKRATYPAGFKVDNVISVAAISNQDKRASFSNYGQKTVHIAAPGVNILSTVPMDKGKYAVFSGTSMATPHVAGAAALLWSVNKNMTYKDIKERLISTVDKVAELETTSISGGRLNVYNALINKVTRKPERRKPGWGGWRPPRWPR